MTTLAAAFEECWSTHYMAISALINLPPLGHDVFALYQTC
jgi:hypothetical protein